MSETFLDSTIPLDNEKLYIKVYSIIRADHPCKRGVCLCYNEYLRLTRKIDVCILNECIVTEITVNNERRFMKFLYRSPSQSQEQFQCFCKNVIVVFSGIIKQQSTCSILVGDFNAKLSNWYLGQDIDNFATISGYTQMIGQPTHIINGRSSIIDLLFTTIYDKCHHNKYGSLDLNIPLPPPYYRDDWDYKRTGPICIHRAISLVNWNDVFSNKTVDEKVESLNNTLLLYLKILFVIKFSESTISIPTG